MGRSRSSSTSRRDSNDPSASGTGAEGGPILSSTGKGDRDSRRRSPRAADQLNPNPNLPSGPVFVPGPFFSVDRRVLKGAPPRSEARDRRGPCGPGRTDSRLHRNGATFVSDQATVVWGEAPERRHRDVGLVEMGLSAYCACRLRGRTLRGTAWGVWAVRGTAPPAAWRGLLVPRISPANPHVQPVTPVLALGVGDRRR